MTWVWDHSRSAKTQRLVLLALADCASDDGQNAYPSMAELMRKTGLSERGVQGSVSELIAIGELEVDFNGGPKGCNRYRIIMTPAGDAPPKRVRGARRAGRRKDEASQAKAGNPARPAAPADSAPPQGVHPEPSKNSSSKSSSRGTRIPDDFQVTPEMVAWARERTPNVDGRRETEKFVNYWQAKSSNATKVNWVLTWRNWMLTAAERTGGGTGHTNFANPNDPSVYEWVL